MSVMRQSGYAPTAVHVLDHSDSTTTDPRRARPLGANGTYLLISRRRLDLGRTPLSLLPLGTLAHNYPCHVMIISLLAWQQFGSNAANMHGRPLTNMELQTGL